MSEPTTGPYIKLLRVDPKTDGPIVHIRRKFDNLATWKKLYGKYVTGEYDVLVFSEVREPVPGVKEYAAEHGYELFITPMDQQGFRMMVLYKSTLPMSPVDITVDLSSFYTELAKLKEQQQAKSIDKEHTFAEVEIGGKTYRLDLKDFNFDLEPSKRAGVLVGSLLIVQLTPPGPPTPKTMAENLAKVMFLLSAHAMGLTILADANLPSDMVVKNAKGENVLQDILGMLPKIPLNNGETTRMTRLDAALRCLFGCPGFKPSVKPGESPVDACLAHKAELDLLLRKGPVSRVKAVNSWFEETISNKVFYEILEILEKGEFLKSLEVARKLDKDEGTPYVNVNSLWETMPGLLLAGKISEEDVINFCFEGDHITTEVLLTVVPLGVSEIPMLSIVPKVSS